MKSGKGVTCIAEKNVSKKTILPFFLFLMVKDVKELNKVISNKGLLARRDPGVQDLNISLLHLSGLSKA